MKIVRQFYKSGNLKYIASIESGEILMLRMFGDISGQEQPVDKNDYEFMDGCIQFSAGDKSTTNGLSFGDQANNMRIRGDNVYLYTSRCATSVDELVYRTNMLTEEMYRQNRRIEELEVRAGTKVGNKTTFVFSNGSLVVGREVNDPAFNGLCGWTKLFHINFTGRGGWRNIIWIKGFWENNSLGRNYDKQA